MSGWLFRIVRVTITTLVGTAIASGILFWLARKGYHPESWVAETLDIATDPTNRTALIWSLAFVCALLAATVIYAIKYALIHWRRPPRSKVQAARAVIAEVQEHCFNTINPNQERADDALSRLRVLSTDLQSDRSLGPILKRILDNTLEYLVVNSTEHRNWQGTVDRHREAQSARGGVSRHR